MKGNNGSDKIKILKNKQCHRKALLISFHLNDHAIGVQPQSQKLEPPCSA